MMKALKQKLARWVLKDIYHGVIEEDFIDTSKMTPPELAQYAKKARAVMRSRPFVAELSRLRNAQERRLFEEAKSQDDLLFGKAVLYTLRLIEDRFTTLSAMAEVEDMKEEMVEEGLY